MNIKESHSHNKILCYNCGTAGHKSSECRKSKGEKRWCNYCKLASHNDSVCRKQSQKYHTKTVKDDDDNHSYAFKVNDDRYLETEENEKFLVDCGATTHIVNFDNFITTDKSSKPEEHFIKLVNGSMSNNVAKKKGTIQITFYTTDGKPVKIKLEDVLYVPSFPQCIFSVRSATGKGAKVNFEG